jgi:hypothetical protein
MRMWVDVIFRLTSLIRILLGATGMEVRGVCSVVKTRLLNTYFSNAALPDLYGQSSKQPPACTHRLVLPMYLEIDFMVSISGLERLLGWER